MIKLNILLDTDMLADIKPGSPLELQVQYALRRSIRMHVRKSEAALFRAKDQLKTALELQAVVDQTEQLERDEMAAVAPDIETQRLHDWALGQAPAGGVGYMNISRRTRQTKYDASAFDQE